MAFITRSLHEAILGKSVKTGQLRMKLEPWDTCFRGQKEKERTQWLRRSNYLDKK